MEVLESPLLREDPEVFFSILAMPPASDLFAGAGVGDVEVFLGSTDAPTFYEDGTFSTFLGSPGTFGNFGSDAFLASFWSVLDGDFEVSTTFLGSAG